MAGTATPNPALPGKAATVGSGRGVDIGRAERLCPAVRGKRAGCDAREVA
jgi:hypothetical protein